MTATLVARSIGSVTLDDGVNVAITDITFPSTRDLMTARIPNRHGRLTWVKEDDVPLVVDVQGWWLDGGGKYWRDFKAALLAQSRVPFVLGDGTRLEMVDVESVQSVLAGRGPIGTAPQQARTWAMKVRCYEPFSREVSPSLQLLAATDLLGGTGTMETPGTTQTLHGDPLNNLNAFDGAFGSAMSLASNVITATPGAGGLFGHPDWDDCTIQVRTYWNTNSEPWVLCHAPGGNQNYIAARLQSAGLALYKVVAGTGTNVATASFTPVNGTWYWLSIAASGTSYTVTLNADSGGAVGAQLATCSGTITDSAVAVGRAGLYNNGGSANCAFGGAFVNVLTVTGPMANGWMVQGVWHDPASFCWSKQQAHSGSRSLSMYVPTTNAYGYFQTNPGFATNAGKSQTWQMYVKGSVASAASGTQYFFDSTDNFNRNYAFTTSWALQSFTYTPTSTGAGGGVTLIPGNYPSDMAGTWYWDDVTVVEAPTQPSAVIVPVSGTTAASPSISYPGSAPAEPTWQVALVIPNGVTVTQVSLQNVSSGEPTCTVPNLSLTNGTFYLLLDCSGAGVPSAGPATTPNNNGYALLAHNTVGFGVTLYSTGTGQVDQDFTGKPPHVVPSASPSIPPTPMVNTLALSVVSTGGAPTSVTLSALAPARYYR